MVTPYTPRCSVCKDIILRSSIKPHVLVDCFRYHAQLTALPFVFVEQASKRNIPQCPGGEGPVWEVVVRQKKERSTDIDRALIREAKNSIYTYELWIFFPLGYPFCILKTQWFSDIPVATLAELKRLFGI